MKSRFSFIVLVLMLTSFSVIKVLSQAHSAAARQGRAVSEAEALPALAQGWLPPVNPARQPANPLPSTLPTDTLIALPGLLSTPLELSGTIALASDRNGPFDIFVQDASGGTAEPLVSSPGNDATPVWSPDGTQLVFASDRDGDFEIYLRQANGAEQKLTDNSVEDFHPSWEPDGTRILFTSNQGGGYYQAYTMNLSGGDVQPVGIVNNNVLYPRFSPDGGRIAFMRASIAIAACDWNWDIWVMDSSGNNQVRVTTQFGGDLYPHWTPDGRIIYSSCRNFINADLYIVDPDSGLESQVTDWAGSDELHGVYSPDSEHLAFNATTDGNYEVYIGTWADGASFNFTQNAAADLTPDWNGQVGDACAGANTSLQPLLLAPGWGAADTIAEDGSGFKPMLPYLQAMGYRLGCNLFYAGETAAYLDLYENAAVIRDTLCQAYAAVKAFNPAWDGHLDIIGHSFGGLRSRAFLEDSGLYDGWGVQGVRCQPPYLLPPDKKMFVDNLFTLGSPHGGGTPDLPGALFLGLVHVYHGDWESIGELLFVMPIFNQVHEQPEKVCYWFVSGNAWEQPLTSLTLGRLYHPIQQVIPNDLGVYRLSVYAPPIFWPDQYDDVVRLDTPDMHGYFGPLFFLNSYVYPINTFDAVIRENLGANKAQCQAAQRAKYSPLNVAATLAVPALVLANEMVASGAVASGDFELVESGSTTIYLDWPLGEVDLSLADPAGNLWTPSTAGNDPNVDYLEMTVMSNVASYVFTNTITGTWRYTITAGTLPYEMPYRLVALPERSIAATVTATPWQLMGQAVTITGTVQLADTSRLTGANVEAIISRPDGTTDIVPLFDDGAHQDGAAGDGLYGNSYGSTALDGRYMATVRATGSYEGQAYSRTADALFIVAPNSASLAGQYSEQPRDDNDDGFYDWLDVDAGLTVNTAGFYFVAADLLTLDGEFVAHALTQADLAPGASQMTLSFSGQAIAGSGRDGPYWLTNVTLVDGESGTVVVDRATNAYQTAAYDHTQFGTPPTVYLPLVIGR
jgi:hypothetical protein